MVRLGLAVVVFLLTAYWVPPGRCAGLESVTGWVAASSFFLILTWEMILRFDAQQTRYKAAAEDPGRTLVWLIVLASSGYSLFAAVVVLKDARTLAPDLRSLVLALCLMAVGLAWLLTHTAYTLRYAHLYYRDDEEGVGGLDFPGNTDPTYWDFAYFAFTVGMCFQVSDVDVSSPRIRQSVMIHALLSFVYNTTILALAMSVILDFFH